MALGLYLHFPFCRHKCSYCDFYKELHSPQTETEFYRCLTLETNLVADSIGPGQATLATIYIGGGTPSLTNLDKFENWLEQIRTRFEFAGRPEISFEANPESVSLELLMRLQELGVNRPVFGIQSFDTRHLKLMNRRHRIADTHRSVYWANALGYDNYGVDLLFGFPKQSSSMLSDDLDQLVELDAPHISLYQLTVEEGTPLADKVARGKIKMPDDDFLGTLYRAAHEHLAESGYVRYEVCSFAREGHECRHNLGYWWGHDYIGLGPSAHSFVNGRRFANSPDLSTYVKALDRGERPLVLDESGAEQRMTEAIMLGLRTTRGINRVDFEERFGFRLEDRIRRDQLQILLETGHVEADDEYVRLSDDGLFLIDEITQRLVR